MKPNHIGSPANSVLLLKVLTCFVLLTVVGSNLPLSGAQATIWTDQFDYAPWDVVNIYGSGFIPNTIVSITLTRPDSSVATWNIASDNEGNIRTVYVDGLTLGTYLLTATDGTNFATTTFTDNVTYSTTTTLDAISSPLGAGQTGVSFSGDVSATTAVPNGINMQLKRHSSCPNSAGNANSLGTVVQTVQTSGGNGHFSGTFTAPTAGTYYFYAYFVGFSQGSPPDKETWDNSFSSTCRTVTVTNTVSVTVTTSPSGLTNSIVVDSTTYTSPQTFTWTIGSSHTIAANSPISGGVGTRYVWTSWSDTGAQSHSVTAPSSTTTYTANYQTQYLVKYASTGCVLAVSVPADEWVNAGGAATGVFPSPVSGAGTQCLFVSDDRPGTITAPTTITGTYQTQYKITFDALANVKGDGSGTIVIVAASNKAASNLPFTTDWLNSGASLSYAYQSPVDSAGSPLDTRYRWSSTSGLGQTLQSNTFTVSGAGTITGTYVTQYKITFGQTGLDGSATGTVVSITVDTVTISKTFVQLPYGDFYDAGKSIGYVYSNPVPSSTPSVQFWLYSVTGPSSPFAVGGPNSITGNYRSLPLSRLTAGGCSFDIDNDRAGQQYRQIFTQNSTATYKLTATNPGQFFYNVFYPATPGTSFSLDIKVPYPFVTQGAVPVHVQASVSKTTIDGKECFVGSQDVTSSFTITAAGSLSPSGASIIKLADYSSQAFGSVVTVTVSGQVPASGLAFITIHLDYGLKATTGYIKTYTNGADATAGGGKLIPDLQPYNFAVSGPLTDTQTIESENVFKRERGFAGLVYNLSLQGVQGVSVQIRDNNNNLLGTVVTDADGFYTFPYKHTGKQATFTVKILGYGDPYQAVSIKSNQFVWVPDFEINT